MLRTVFFFATFFPFTLFSILYGLIVSLISADRLHTFARWWARGCLLLAGVNLKVEGAEHLPRHSAVVFMPNHQSNFDIPALFAGLPVQFRWIAKIELFRIPLFGLVMQRTGYIPVDRSDRRKSLESLKEGAQRIAKGTSVVIFPEGTRSDDGTLLPFKKGGFTLAEQAGVPIIPVAIVGSARVMAKHSRTICPGTIRVIICPPLSMSNNLPRDHVMAAVQSAIAAHLAGTGS